MLPIFSGSFRGLVHLGAAEYIVSSTNNKGYRCILLDKIAWSE